MRSLVSFMSLVALLVALSAAVAQASSPTASLGVYRGGGAPAQVAAFERWDGGVHAGYALDFLPLDSGWHAIAHPDWLASRWRNSPYRVVYSVPLLPRGTGSLAAGARGDYDGYFASMARTLVAHGQGSSILRIGWEFNGSWFPWAANRNPQAFVDYWRHVVRAVRSVPGADFMIDWAPNLGRGAIAPDRVYPGDGYVDVIGMDAYDQDWSPEHADDAARWVSLRDQAYGLRWHRAFAQAHGKPESFPEWGLTIRPGGWGGGDSAAYIEHMHDWIAAGNVLYHCYFEFDAADGQHRMMTGRFPQGAAAFKRLFGPAGGATTPAAASGLRITGVRKLAGRLRVVGRLARASRVRLAVHTRRAGRWRPVSTRTVPVRAGHFTATLRRPPGAVRLVATVPGGSRLRTSVTV